MTSDLVLEKVEIIENCLRRVREEYAGHPDHIYKNFTKQDSIFMNLERACQAAIDLAMHWVRKKKLGVPKDSRAAFDLLEKAKILPSDLADAMKRMVGFRNIAVHQYREIDLKIVEDVVKNRLGDFEKFARVVFGLVEPVKK